MARGPKRRQVQPGESRQLRLHLSAGVLAILDAEAELMQLDAARFFRMLIRRRMGLQQVARSTIAERPQPLAADPGTKEAYVIVLATDLLGFFHGLCNRLGGGSPATVASDLILEWVGISPLDRDVVVPIAASPPQPSQSSTRRRTPSRPTKVQLLSLATPIITRLEEEAAAMGIRHTELLRNLLRAKMGIAGFTRGESAPAAIALEDVEHAKQNYRVHLPVDQVKLIDELVRRLGGGEKSTIVSHLILDFLGISPLR